MFGSGVAFAMMFVLAISDFALRVMFVVDLLFLLIPVSEFWMDLS